MLFLTGYHASGKSHLAHHLEAHDGFLHIETSAIVREIHEAHAADTSLGAWAESMEAAHGDRYFDDQIVAAIIKRFSQVDPVRSVITGNRSFEGIDHTRMRLAQELGARAGQALIVFVATSPEVMYERFVERNRYEGDASISYGEYVKMMDDEKSRGIEEIRQHADVSISNDGLPDETLAQLYESLDRLAYHL